MGTGFSYSDLGDPGVVTEAEMAEDMYEFFQAFFTKFPKYLSRDFFIFGESYGGQPCCCAVCCVFCVGC